MRTMRKPALFALVEYKSGRKEKITINGERHHAAVDFSLFEMEKRGLVKKWTITSKRSEINAWDK